MANLAAFLTAKHFPKSGELLVFGNFPVNQLAEIYGTPMFVYDRAVLDLKYDAFRSALPERITASKAILHLPFRLPASDLAPLAGTLGILAGIRNPRAPARNTSSFARTLEIPYSRKSIKTRAPGNICDRISVSRMGTAASGCA